VNRAQIKQFSADEVAMGEIVIMLTSSTVEK
jgi:hypothetical protein